MEEEKVLIPDGKHLLSGVQEFHLDENDERNWAWWGVIDGYAIVVDGKTYLAIEDPDDGYRSYAYITVPENFVVEVTNQFEPQIVYVHNFHDTGEEEDGWMTRDEYGIRFDNQYGQTVLSVSTDHSDSYYPIGMVEYNPENLPCNAKPLVN